MSELAISHQLPIQLQFSRDQEALGPDEVCCRQSPGTRLDRPNQTEIGFAMTVDRIGKRLIHGLSVL